MGLESGRHTIKLTSNNSNKELIDFTFEEQTVQVVPGLLIPVDVNGIGNNALSDVIIDSHHYRGLNFTVNGYPLNATVPAKARLARFDSFVTIRENESFVSHQIPTTLNEEPVSPHWSPRLPKLQYLCKFESLWSRGIHRWLQDRVHNPLHIRQYF